MMTRRELAALVATAGAAAAQNADPADDLTVQRENLRKSSEALRAVRVEETLEPSFVFRP